MCIFSLRYNFFKVRIHLYSKNFEQKRINSPLYSTRKALSRNSGKGERVFNRCFKDISRTLLHAQITYHINQDISEPGDKKYILVRFRPLRKFQNPPPLPHLKTPLVNSSPKLGSIYPKNTKSYMNDILFHLSILWFIFTSHVYLKKALYLPGYYYS
jgi:hypothetical protein